jgi:hypothetical protein
MPQPPTPTSPDADSDAHIIYPETCERCGYSLTGLAADDCPECGEPVQMVVTAHAAWGLLGALDISLAEKGIQTELIDMPSRSGPLPALLGMPEQTPRRIIRVDKRHEAVVRATIRQLGGGLLKPIVARSEPTCPRCRGPLNAVGEAICPSCGAQFEWIDDEELGVTDIPAARAGNRIRLLPIAAVLAIAGAAIMIISTILRAWSHFSDARNPMPPMLVTAAAFVLAVMAVRFLVRRASSTNDR